MPAHEGEEGEGRGRKGGMGGIGGSKQDGRLRVRWEGVKKPGRLSMGPLDSRGSRRRCAGAGVMRRGPISPAQKQRKFSGLGKSVVRGSHVRSLWVLLAPVGRGGACIGRYHPRQTLRTEPGIHNHF